MNFASDLVYAYDRDLSDASSDSDSEDDLYQTFDSELKMAEEEPLPDDDDDEVVLSSFRRPPAPQQQQQPTKAKQGFLSSLLSFSSSNTTNSVSNVEGMLAPPTPTEGLEQQQEEYTQQPSYAHRHRHHNHRPRTEKEKKKRKQKKMVKKQMGRRARRHVDTNVISVNLGTLGGDVSIATGDPVFCSHCQACLSTESLKFLKAKGSEGKQPEEGEGNNSNTDDLVIDEEGEYIWTCEFCGTENEIQMEEEEKPSSKSTDYILEAPPVPELEAQNSSGDSGDFDIVFVLDVSGSMCQTMPIEGKVSLKGDKTSDLQKLRGVGEGDQWLPGENRNVTYVSRLQAVQAAVDNQLDTIAQTYPNVRVGLVAFSNEVRVLGDGSREGGAITVSGDRLSNMEALLEVGANNTLNHAISDSRELLAKMLFDLEEGGPTALGPAVLTAIGMVRGRRGSKIVVCTDGLANIGLGSLEDLNTDEDLQRARDFYEEVGSLAQGYGVVLDVIGIEGDTCDLENLGVMSDATGGEVTLVDPTNIQKDFSNIMANPVLATDVSVRLMLHKALFIRGEAKRDDVCWTERQVGNVTTDTEFTLEYGMRSKEERERLGVSELGTVPFQLQIRYTRLNGMRCVRVMTQCKRVTRDRTEAERLLSPTVIAVHSAQQSASLANKGEYTEGRKNMRAWGDLLNRGGQESETHSRVLEAYNREMHDLDDAIGEIQVNELRTMGRRLSDSEGEDLEEEGEDLFDNEEQAFSFMSARMEKQSNARRKGRSNTDRFANKLQKKSRMTSAGFL